LDNKTIQHLIG